MRARENVFENLTLCLTYGGTILNGRIKTGHCYSGEKAGWDFDRPGFKF